VSMFQTDSFSYSSMNTTYVWLMSFITNMLTWIVIVIIIYEMCCNGPF